MYYSTKVEALRDVFGAREVEVQADRLIVDGRVFPVVNDVIVALSPDRYPAGWRGSASAQGDFAPEIQFTFGAEWQTFNEILPEHRQEFEDYFDIVDLGSLAGARVCDLGCGMGRWSYFLAPHCRELVLADFSEAIFEARRNLRHVDNAIFVMADVRELPFRPGFADFLFCLGVLHHLPTNALDEVRSLSSLAPRLLIYLYYALDNRATYFKAALGAVTLLRRVLSGVSQPKLRSAITSALAAGVYLPLIALGTAFPSRHIPLHDTYKGKSWGRIRQDVYDRFFTRIEQRFTRAQILTLKDTFSEVRVSDGLPYWHFLCAR